MSEFLAAAAANMGMPESLVMRSGLPESTGFSRWMFPNW